MGRHGHGRRDRGRSPRRNGAGRGRARPNEPAPGSPAAAGGPGAGRTAGGGTLFVVGTPIGNLDDLSARAVATLRRAALIACEDTRVTHGLLHRHGIASPVVSCHRFNEAARTGRILEILATGGDVALVSDGGTPGVSDPGAVVVQAVRAAGFAVSPVPGPSAATALWSVSGFTGTELTIVGFLPQRRGERRRALSLLRAERRPLLFFESPHRVLDMLADVAEILGGRHCCLGREMTKVHEEFLAGTPGELRASLESATPRGEFAIVVAGAAVDAGASVPPPGAGPGEAAAATSSALDAAAVEVMELMQSGIDKGTALRRVARARRIPRRAIYARLARSGRNRRGAPGDEEE